MQRTENEGKLGMNAHYYKYIFKKTEKIICAVFYILRSVKKTDHDKDPVVAAVERTALETITRALESLEVHQSMSAQKLEELRHQLVELLTKLRILSASNMLDSNLLHVFTNEIDSVIRTIRGFANTDSENPLFSEESVEMIAQKPTRSRQPAGSRTAHADVPQSASQVAIAADRRTRILDVLKSKETASIKDISDVITDCSEKTIQRELNTLIKDNIVLRKGQRRWSTYSLAG